METPPPKIEISLKEKLEQINFGPFFIDWENLKKNQKGALNFKSLEERYKNELSVVSLVLEEKGNFIKNKSGDALEDRIETKVLLNIDNSRNFIAYLNAIDWENASQSQVNDLKNFVKILISEVQSDYRELDDNFLDFYNTWPKLIEKFDKIGGYEVQNLSRTLNKYIESMKGGYLHECTMADKKGFLTPFKEIQHGEDSSPLTDNHLEIFVNKYKTMWEEEVFEFLEKIKENPKATPIYGEVLDFAYDSAKYVENNLDVMLDNYYNQFAFRKTGASRRSMLGMIDVIIARLEKLRDEFESHK